MIMSDESVCMLYQNQLNLDLSLLVLRDEDCFHGRVAVTLNLPEFAVLRGIGDRVISLSRHSAF